MKNLFFILLFLSYNLFAQQPTFTRQTSESLIKYLTDNNVQFDKADITTLRDINIFSYYNSTEKLTVPEAYFFNREGYRINGFSGTDCGNEITGLQKINKKSFDKNETINDWVSYFSFIQPNKEEDLLNSGYDFFVVINWAVFLPKMNEVSFNWYYALKKEKKYKIRIFLSNLDIQKDWELNQAQKDALNLN